MATSPTTGIERATFSDLEAIQQHPIIPAQDILYKERAPEVPAETEINPLDDKEHPEYNNESAQGRDQGRHGLQVCQLAPKNCLLCLGLAALIVILAVVLGGVLGSRHKDSQTTTYVKVRRHSINPISVLRLISVASTPFPLSMVPSIPPVCIFKTSMD